MDRLSPVRAPLAVAALAVLTLVAAARVVLGLSEVVTTGGSRAVAAARLAPNGSDAALTVLVGVLVVSCFGRPEVPTRRRLALWGAALTVLSVLATLVALGLTDPSVAGWNLVWGLPDLAVPALVGAGLLVLGLPRATGTAAAAHVPVPPAVDEPAAPAPDPGLAPTWTQDAAAGAVWRTAGEAARGAPAQDWGSAGDTSWAAPPRASGTPASPGSPDERDDADRSS